MFIYEKQGARPFVKLLCVFLERPYVTSAATERVGLVRDAKHQMLDAFQLYSDSCFARISKNLLKGEDNFWERFHIPKQKISTSKFIRKHLNCVRFEDFTAVTMKNAVLWDKKTQFVPHRRHITSPLQSPASYC
jgi:hypothetical protein